jgi:hypothetical protein
MKQATVRRLCDTPGSRVSLPDKQLHVNGAPASVPWFSGAPPLLLGALLAMPRVGAPMKIAIGDPLSLGRFAAPSLFDSCERVSTLRKALGLRERQPGEYVTPIEPGSGVLVKPLVGELKQLKAVPDWKAEFVAGVANAVPDALANGINVADGAADWAAAIIEAAEA